MNAQHAAAITAVAAPDEPRRSARAALATALLYGALAQLVGPWLAEQAWMLPTLADSIGMLAELAAGILLLLADPGRLFALLGAAVMAAIQDRAARYGLLPTEACLLLRAGWLPGR